MKIVIFIEDYVMGGHNVVVANIMNSWPVQDEFILVSNKDNIGINLIKKKLKRPCRYVIYSYNYEHRLRSLKVPFPLNLLWKILIVTLRYPLLILQMFFLLDLLRKLNPAKFIISNGGYPGAPTCRAAAMTGLFKQKWGKPFFIYHNLPVKPRFLIAPIEFIVDLLLEKSVEKLITVSNAAESKITNRRGLCRSKKLKVIYNGIDEPEKKGTGLLIKKELKLIPEANLILTIANFEKRKGHEFLLSAMAEVHRFIPNVHLLLAGTGERERIIVLKKYAQKVGLRENIHFLGFRDNILDLLRQVEVLAVPSQEYESFGIIIVEAMSQKIPVVGTNVGGIPEVVKNGLTGYICDRSDTKEFSAKIISLLKDKEKRKRFGEAGYARFKTKFRASQMAQRYYNLVNNLQN